MMLSLLSGLIGAFIATLLNVLYNHISEQKKIKSHILMETVSYCDEIYCHLIDMNVYKDHEYTNKKQALHPEEYRMITLELRRLQISSKVATKLVIAYGEGIIIDNFNELKAYFNQVSSILRKATKDDWSIKKEEINMLFFMNIEPLRDKLQRSLLDKLHAIEIIKGSFRKAI